MSHGQGCRGESHPRRSYPGEIVQDEGGKEIASTATIFSVVIAGGRAPLNNGRSAPVSNTEYRSGTPHVLRGHVVTPQVLIKAFNSEQGVDISALYDRGNIATTDYESSLKRDTRILRESKGTPKNVNIYGYLFNIDTGIDPDRGGPRGPRRHKPFAGPAKKT